MKSLLFGLLFTLGSAFSYAQTCYTLSVDGEYWSESPETLCITEPVNTSLDGYDIAITATPVVGPTDVAHFTLSLLYRSEDAGLMQDVYGVRDDGNSDVARKLRIRFFGRVDQIDGTESGFVQIFGQTFYYDKVIN